MRNHHEPRGGVFLRSTVFALFLGSCTVAGFAGHRASSAERDASNPKAPGTNTTSDCASCHSETVLLPDEATFDASGIYPFGAQAEAFESGRRVPLLAEAIELTAPANPPACTNCHGAHGSPNFEINRDERVKNMGLWANIKPSPAGTLHLEVKVRNLDSAHRAPAGRIGAAYVVTAEARQHRKPLELRYGPRLWPSLLTDQRDAGLVFGRDYRDKSGASTSDATKVAALVADTRLESGRFQTVNFMYDRLDDSSAHVDVVLLASPRRHNMDRRDGDSSREQA